jgi:hypothetical protein
VGISGSMTEIHLHGLMAGKNFKSNAAKQARLPVEYLFAVSLVNLIFATHKKLAP